MFRRLSLVVAATLVLTLAAEEALARNPAYYGTRRATSARVYSGQYQALRPNVVPTFSLPIYGNGFRTQYGAGYYGRGAFYRPVYPQPLVIYPPAVYYGF